MGNFRYAFAGVISEKGLVINGRALFDRTMVACGVGTEVVLTVENRREKRSSAQNRLMWGTTYDQLIAGIAAEAGYDRHERELAKELIHEGLCAKYGGTVTDPVTKEQVRKFRTSKATKQEFSDYIEWVARFAAQEYGVVIALPGEAA